MEQYSGGIRRGPRKADQFTIISNDVINDTNLSFRARGVLMWLLSKPADWRTRSDVIAAASPKEGREAIRTAMRELEQHGYLVREKVQNELGQWSTIQTVYEEPITDTPIPPKPRKSDPGDQTVGEQGALLKTEELKTETNNNTSPQQRHSPPPQAKTEPVLSNGSTLRDALQVACQKAGLTARWDRLKPADKKTIDTLIAQHGIDKLVAVAHRLHRPDNPTLFASGWITAWSALPAPRRASRWKSCGKCDEYGWLPEDEHGRAVKCSCRDVAAA